MAESLQQKSDNQHLRILVVEDSDLLKELFLHAFDSSHIVEVTPTLQEGWKLYVEREPHIVFLDVGLPDGNGHDLARRIKKRNPSAYVVMATGSRYREDKEEAAFNHVDGFITKPFDKKGINDFVERYIALNRRAS
jgi:two-component system chemotaxis response regulator CheY